MNSSFFYRSFRFTVIIISTLLFFEICISNAQGYIPFPTDSAIWRIDLYTQCAPNFPVPAGMYQYTIEGDTVINLNTYKKILASGIGDCFPTPGYFAGSYRDDTIARKVFFIRPGSSSEELLYDFNLIVGDTIKGYFDDGLNHTVESIDTINLGGINRKRMKFFATNLNPYFIEGIGSTSGLLELIEQIGFDCNFICYSHKGQTIYPDNITSCNIINKVEEVNSTFPISINPNPVIDESYISINNNNITKIEIYDVLGKLIFSETPFSSKALIQKNKLNVGIYFCKAEIEQNSNAFVFKIIIQ